jgi:glycosyltransferase involved in cell wall biosynthesis
MNILALNWNDLKNPFAGGAEVHLEELLRRLVTYGHKVTLVCSGWPGCAEEEVVEGVRIIRTGRRHYFNLVVPFLLRDLVKREKFDVLIEDINKIPFYTPWYLEMKTLVVIPHLFATTVFQEINPVLGSYIYLAEKPLLSVYGKFRFNVISESTADDMVARGLPKDRVSVIHCGIDRNTYSVDSSMTKYEKPTVLYLGRLKKYKSVQHLIIAFKKLKSDIPDARLMIVGAGDYQPSLESLGRALGVSNDIEFTGFVPTADKLTRMRRSHVCVLPSIREGWGLTNIEANAVGTTVVAANSPGLRDSVRDGETGFLYEYGNAEQLADRLKQILTKPDLRKTLEAGGLQWADRFSWDDAAKKFESLVYQVVQEPRP